MDTCSIPTTSCFSLFESFDLQQTTKRRLNSVTVNFKDFFILLCLNIKNYNPPDATAIWFSPLIIGLLITLVTKINKILINLHQRMSTEGDYFTEVDVLCGPANTNLFNKAHRRLY